jgi:hypothetical protein
VLKNNILSLNNDLRACAPMISSLFGTEDEINSVQITNNQMYPVKTLSMNYTTYDIRRDWDTINPGNHNFVMVRSPKDGGRPDVHPHWYAQVLGVYHAFVSMTHPAARYRSVQCMKFL